MPLILAVYWEFHKCCGEEMMTTVLYKVIVVEGIASIFTAHTLMEFGIGIGAGTGMLFNVGGL